MNKAAHHHTGHDNGEHGTVRSYVIGFILSLIFTFIPYYLVVNKVISGNVLLTAILSIAIIQMLIQIFYFLHLGRGPKPMYNIFFFAATAVTILVVVAASVFIMNNLYNNMDPSEISKKVAEKEGIYQIGGELTGACHYRKENHKVVIKNGEVVPSYIDAELCDSLTFINEDDQKREIAFGTHPNHDSYGGETEVILRKGRPKSITLNEAGRFMFHDHLDPVVSGGFSVTK